MKLIIKQIIFFLCLCVFGSNLAWAHTPLAYIKTNGSEEELKPIYWQQVLDGVPIPFAINNAGTSDINVVAGAPEIDEFEAIELAFQTWENVADVGVQFSLQGTDTNSYGFDGENVIFFADIGDVGYGGVTIITYDNTTGEILDTDIHLNDHNIRWFTSQNDIDGEPLGCPCEGDDVTGIYSNDIQGLTTHEIGHVLGLDHTAIGIRESAATPTMYPLGIWNVPGDGDRPANSRYRTIELDDITGLKSLYLPQDSQSGEIVGVVHDNNDSPLFGAHIVAKNLVTGEEISVMSGMVEGVYQAENFRMQGVPPGQYEVRVEPIDGSGPGFVGSWNFGGIANAAVPAKFPAKFELNKMYHKLTYDSSEANPVSILGGSSESVNFRPIVQLEPLPKLLRNARAFEIAGKLNLTVTGALTDASLIYSVDGGPPVVNTLALSPDPFSVTVPLQNPGSLLNFYVTVETSSGDNFQSLTRSIQIGLSGEPLLFISKTGSGELSAVDTKTMHEVDTVEGLSYPVGQVFSDAQSGLYVSNFGTDKVTFISLVPELPPTTPSYYDTDGDGLIDSLETLFGTDVNNPDTDNDFALDGDEISQLTVDLSQGLPSFEVVAGTVANDGSTPIGVDSLNIVVWNVTNSQWASAAMRLTPSGRYSIKLVADTTYYIVYYYQSAWHLKTVNFTAAAGEKISLDVIQVDIPPPNPIAQDTGTNPNNSSDGASLFSLATIDIPLESQADSYDLTLSPDQQSLFVSGSGSDKVYKINTATNSIVAETQVGSFPKGIAITNDGAKLYVANKNSGFISVLDTTSLAPITTVPVQGNAESIAMIGTKALVTQTNTAADAVWIDTTTDLENDMFSGLNGLDFLRSSLADPDLAIAGPFQVGSHKLALVDLDLEMITPIDLGPEINGTSGVALHPDGVRGYAIHYLTPELLEFDLQTGSIQRRLSLGFIDARNILLTDFTPAGNAPPTIDPVLDQTIDEGEPLSFSINASDANGDALSLTTILEDGSELSTIGASFIDNGDNTGTFNWTPTTIQAGTYLFVARANDGESEVEENFSIVVQNVNLAPQLDPISDTTINESELLQFNVTASDPDGDSLTITMTLDDGSDLSTIGASFIDNGDNSASFSWTPNTIQVGTYTFTARVNDSELESADNFIVEVLPVNLAPVLDSIGDKTVNENDLLEFSVTANDPDQDTLIYSAAILPPGSTFNTATQTFSWVPSSEQSGDYSITFSVDDGDLQDEETINISVVNVGVPPIPANLSLLPVSSKKIDATWSDVVDETSYELQWSKKEDFSSGVKTKVLGADITSHTAKKLKRNTTYYFRLRACNSFGCSQHTNTVSATTL